MTILTGRTAAGETSGRRQWLTLCGSLAVTATLLAGCGGGEAPSQVETPAVAPPAAISDDARVAMAAATPVAEPAPAPPAIDPAAQEAFARLCTQGVPLEEWEAAHAKLIEMGAAGVPALVQGLQSADPVDREMAVTILALIGPEAEAAVEPLEKALSDDSIFVRANAATALCQFPGHADAVIPVLSELLEAEDPQLRRLAAVNLGYFGVEAQPLIAKLTAVLDDEEAEVVLPVVELLGRIGPPAREAVPKLQQIAFEQEGDIRQAATQAIAEIQAEKSPPAEK